MLSGMRMGVGVCVRSEHPVREAVRNKVHRTFIHGLRHVFGDLLAPVVMKVFI